MNDRNNSGNSGGGRPGKGSGRPDDRNKGPRRGAGPNKGRANEQRQSPVEVAARSTRNALRRHAEALRNDEQRLSCRGILSGITAVSSSVDNPGELIAVVELAMQAVEHRERSADRLPVTLRAVVAYAVADGRRIQASAEMLRLTLRHSYALAADHIPRQVRDDARFRASSLADSLNDVAREYMNDAAFSALQDA